MSRARRQSVALLAFGVVALLLAGCFMSLDENRWRTDARGDRPSRELSGDLPRGDGRPDAPLDQPALPDRPADNDAEQRDGPKPDAKKLDGPKPDAKKLDGPKPDTKKLDGPKPDTKIDGPKPDTKKIDGPPKPDLPKPPDLPSDCTSITLSLVSAPDDGEIWAPTFFPDGEAGSEIFIGHDGGLMWGYFRFALTGAIPGSATITAATLSLWGAGSWQWGANKALELRAELSADAPAVTAAANAPGGSPSARPVTSALVRWPASGGLSWTNGQYNVTPSLVPILQEVVTSKGGLALGSHLQLWLRGAQVSDGAVITPDFKASTYSSHPAKLSITFCK